MQVALDLLVSWFRIGIGTTFSSMSEMSAEVWGSMVNLLETNLRKFAALKNDGWGTWFPRKPKKKRFPWKTERLEGYLLFEIGTFFKGHFCSFSGGIFQIIVVICHAREDSASSSPGKINPLDLNWDQWKNQVYMWWSFPDLTPGSRTWSSGVGTYSYDVGGELSKISVIFFVAPIFHPATVARLTVDSLVYRGNEMNEWWNPTPNSMGTVKCPGENLSVHN